ncbi:MAG: tripartite tricarboxylate transporter permease [Oscillospiraceae bacterium]|jgi:putative tricarboxylic transport membrane protein|nr:tripartite tricarboxylate transporter permease [Oscillospiraceae bacterium]
MASLFSGYFAGFSSFFTPYTSITMILWIAVGVFLGIYLGAIPGLSVTMAVSLLISFTFSWDTYPALALMIGVFTGGVYGGSRAAVLLNIPGAPAAVATTFDGYPLAKKGEAGIAMGLSTTESVIGGFVGLLCLMLFSPLIGRLAVNFSARDYLLLAIMALFLVGSLSKGSLSKALITAFLGVVVGMIGMDPVTAQPRLTFGIPNLLAGVNFVVVMIGLFGMSEALYQLHYCMKPVKQKVQKILPSWSIIKENLPLALRSSLLGMIVGALPGTGGDIASLIAYDHAKRVVKNPNRPFGEGAYAGVIAPESANNAAIGGSFIPMMTLGIPGDSVTAILIGALTIHGIRPGPLLMNDQPQFFWMIVGSLMLANCFLLIFGLTGIRMFCKVVEVPKHIIIPVIVVLSIIGSYSINNSVMDIYLMFFFGILGYLFKMHDFPVATMVLGIILSGILDTNWRRAMNIAHNHFGEFISGFFTHPISLLLLLLIIFVAIPKSKKQKIASLFHRKSGAEA